MNRKNYMLTLALVIALCVIAVLIVNLNKQRNELKIAKVQTLNMTFNDMKDRINISAKNDYKDWDNFAGNIELMWSFTDSSLKLGDYQKIRNMIYETSQIGTDGSLSIKDKKRLNQIRHTRVTVSTQKGDIGIKFKEQN